MNPSSSLPAPSLPTQAQAEAEGREPSPITCMGQVAWRVPEVTPGQRNTSPLRLPQVPGWVQMDTV